tara:strand:- start:43031 stop:44224 length:1194 start_codon:yes stop_codon:yes gene_type:complete
MSRLTLDRWKQLSLFVIYFLCISLLLFFNDTYIRTAPDLKQLGEYHAFPSFLTYILGGLFGGIMIAIFELFLLGNLFKKYGLIVLSLGRGVFLVAVYLAMTIALSFAYNVVTAQLPPYDPAVLVGVWEYMTGPVVLINLVFYSVFVIILIFFHQIVDLVGRGVLGKFLFGRYKVPRVVDRTFLFMDMNASTTVAEQIGHVSFFELMQDFLVQAGIEIREHGGEINKYVGDEIIAVWNVDGGARRALALKCLLAIAVRLQKRASYYQEIYGLVPDFKSALHVGPAMVGELGDWKREVAYMGDTLNTAARIQGACKKLKARVLISEDYQRLMIDTTPFKMEFAGKGRLRGKEKALSLFRVETVEPTVIEPSDGKPSGTEPTDGLTSLESARDSADDSEV